MEIDISILEEVNIENISLYTKILIKFFKGA